MSYEYFFHTPRYKPFDKELIEERVRALPYIIEDVAKDGSHFYTVARDEETRKLIQSVIESGNTFGVPDFGDEVTIRCDEVIISLCGCRNEAFRSFCIWLVHEFGCSIKNEFDDPSSLERCFRRWLNDEECARVASGDYAAPLVRIACYNAKTGRTTHHRWKPLWALDTWRADNGQTGSNPPACWSFLARSPASAAVMMLTAGV